MLYETLVDWRCSIILLYVEWIRHRPTGEEMMLAWGTQLLLAAAGIDLLAHVFEDAFYGA
jgi:hypothetical protein